MKSLYVLLCGFLCITQNIHADHPVRHVKQVILWGHKLHSHTHSYIHWGFYRAFKYMGYNVYWLDNNDNVANRDLTNSLFITEGQVDQKIPIRNDCYYIIHNCKPDKYRQLLSTGRAIILQVYTHDCLKRNEPALAFCFHYDLTQPILYMPWATDVLPHEIEDIKQQIATEIHKNNTASFIGTINSGMHGNRIEVEGFKKACTDQGIQFHHDGITNRSMEENIQFIKHALLAPALQGSWQCKQGYIPCRIFKNISYGAMPITNSKTVYKLFDKKILYNPDPYQLGLEAIKRIKTWTLKEQYELMDLVKEKHTYLNRIEALFQFFEMVAEYQKGMTCT